MKALVLAAGLGTRLRPLTNTIPKHLIPVANKPTLHYVMDRISETSIKDVGVVISPENGDQIRQSLSINPWEFKFSYITQDQPLGLAHAVIVARSFLKKESFLMFLGDNLIGGNIKDFVTHFQNSNFEASIMLKTVADPRNFGVANIDHEGIIHSLIEKPTNPKSDLAIVGIYIFSPKIHSIIDSISPSKRGELEITDALQELIIRGKNLFGNRFKDWWIDTGTITDLLNANEILIKQQTHLKIRGIVDKLSKISGEVVIGHGTRIESSEILGPAIIGNSCVIKNSQIGPNTSIDNNCLLEKTSITNCIIMENSKISNIRLCDKLVGENVIL